MIYPDCYWLNAYLLPFVGMSTLLWLGAWNFLSMAIIFEYFKRKPHCANIQNLFKNCIFVISVQNCTLQLNFKAHLPAIKYSIFNAKSLIQPTWCHLLPENFSKSKLSTIISGQCLLISKNYGAMFPATWCIYWHHRFSKFCNFIFGAKNRYLQ